MKAKVKYYIVVLVSALLGMSTGCKKFVEVPPPINDLVGSEIYSSNKNAAAVLSGIYAQMSDNGIFSGINSLAFKTGLSADELSTVTGEGNLYTLFYTNNLTRTDGDNWMFLYYYVFQANAAIEGISQSSGITEPAKKQLLGEAKFIRAFMYFYLVNLYGDVPLVLTTNVQKSSVAPREKTDIVYKQIIQDLKDAQAELGPDYVGPDAVSVVEDRVRPNLFAATALLARVYLYTQDWQQAINEATKVIDENSKYKFETIDNVFLNTSQETIWSVQSFAIGLNTVDANTLVLQGDPSGYPTPGPDAFSRPFYLSASLISTFDSDDKRLQNWIGSVTVDTTTYNYAYKYKSWQYDQPQTENLILLRLAEQYLIRAEARAHLGILTGANSASSDLNTVRSRAGLLPVDLLTTQQAVNAILTERRKELFTESGHRWFDLKRTGIVNQVMETEAKIKGGTWSAYKALYPIPIQDIQRNPSLKGHQNPGYPEF